MKKTALVLTAFGTSTAARDTYAFFETRVRERFPNHDILWAYTSHTLRLKMAREGLSWQSPAELLGALQGKGYRKAVLQSLHIVPGKEFEKIAAAARQASLPVAAGMPLLTSRHDCEGVVDALSEDMATPADAVTVVVGHGTAHAGANTMYRLFQACLKKRYPDSVRLSMVEGEPSWEVALDVIRRRSVKKVRFVPLMFVAGDHMVNDVLGEIDSWAAQLAGYTVEAQTKGLGFNERVVQIYCEHLQEALNRV